MKHKYRFTFRDHVKVWLGVMEDIANDPVGSLFLAGLTVSMSVLALLIIALTYR